jgi:hypothetical protein
VAGAIEDLAQHGRTVALVSHRSSSKIAAAQRYLVEQLRTRFGHNRVRHIPVWASLIDGDLAREPTHRTRSFLFVALAAVTARLFGLDRVEFYENGIVSLNLPLVAQVVGARATRTTHPQALAGFRTVLSALLARPFDVANLFMWLTKADVVGRIDANGLGELIPHTRSCSRVRDMSKLHPHCGLCSQCVDRRVGVLAAGLERHDPIDGYKVELFRGRRPAGPDLEMGLAYVRSARHISRMSDVAFFSSFGEANRALAHFAEPTATIAERIYDLYQRHARHVVDVFERGIAVNARALAEGCCPQDCLLVLAVGGGRESAEPMAAPMPAGAGQPTMVPDAPPEAAQLIQGGVRMIIDHDRQEVSLEGWGVIRGVGATTLIALAEPFRSAVRDELAPERYPFMPAHELMRRLRCDTEETLRCRINRLRGKPAALAAGSLSRSLPMDAIVESVPWHGYRLNPDHVRIVALTKAEAEPAGSVGPNPSAAPGRRPARSRRQGARLGATGH